MAESVACGPDPDAHAQVRAYFDADVDEVCVSPARGVATLSPIVFALLADRIKYASASVVIAASAAVVTAMLIRYVPET